RYDLTKAATTRTRESVAARRAGGLWRWAELLPVRESRFVTHLGEGDTALQPARGLAAWLGLPRLLVKRESLNPTGSFKARGMAVAVSRAAELGATHLVAPSAGNAGGALAAYAAATGVRATVIMPADAPAINQVEVLITGADLILLDGLINDCGRLAALVRDELGAFDLSTLKEPYRVEGKKTMGFELAEQLGWRLPDAVGDFLILDCLRESGGSAVAVPELQIVDTRSRLGRLGLGYASLETAAAVAGLEALMELGLIGSEETVALFDTGAGFKSDPPAYVVPKTVPNDAAYWRERVIPTLR